MNLKKMGKHIKYYTVNKIGYVIKENSLEQPELGNLVYNDVKIDIQ